MPFISTTRDDGVTAPEWVDDETDRRRNFSPKVIFALVVVGLIALALGGVLMQINHSFNDELKLVEQVERELKASAELSGSEIRGISVYHYDDGSLVVRWTEGNVQCSDVVLVPPSTGSELWSTETVAEDSGKCSSSHSSSGIGN
jgi:4-amino-4-deoxy-L-arabinose transferase-like glycosyltransferase